MTTTMLVGWAGVGAGVADDDDFVLLFCLLPAAGWMFAGLGSEISAELCALRYTDRCPSLGIN